MARYSDINRAAELADAYAKLQAWRAKTKAQKVAAYDLVAKPSADRVKTERDDGFIVPFRLDTATLRYEARVVNQTQTGTGNTTANTVRNLVDDRFVLTIAANEQSIRPPRGFSFAKIIASERTQTVTANSNSRITNLPYKRHRSNNVSCPFGRKAAGLTEVYGDAIAEIKAKPAFNTFENSVGNRIGFVAEQG